MIEQVLIDIAFFSTIVILYLLVAAAVIIISVNICMDLRGK